MFNKNRPSSAPSDSQSKEKLAIHVYEYLVHVGASKTASSFLQEIRWDKTVPVGEAPGFLNSWWSIFWDLYSAAPERRDSHEHSSEAKAFHDYGFVNSGFPNTLQPHTVLSNTHPSINITGHIDSSTRNSQASHGLINSQRSNPCSNNNNNTASAHVHNLHPGIRFTSPLPSCPQMHRLPPQRWSSLIGSQQGVSVQNSSHSVSTSGLIPPPQSPSTIPNEAHFPSLTPPNTSETLNGPTFIPGSRPSPHTSLDFTENAPQTSAVHINGSSRMMPPPSTANEFPVTGTSTDTVNHLKQSPNMQHEPSDFTSQQNGRISNTLPEFLPNGPSNDSFLSGNVVSNVNNSNATQNTGSGPIHFPHEYSFNPLSQ